MKIFLDTADIEEIRTAARWGVLDGVTTNPSLYAKVGGSYEGILKEICGITSGPVSAEVVAEDVEGMLREGRAFAKLAPNIVVKVPMSEEGLEAISRFAEEGSQEPYIAGLKALTTKPVVGVGRFTSPDAMVRQINKGLLDLIGAARPSIADPFLPRKIAEGREDEIRECIGCNICISSWHDGVPVRCTQNPAAGCRSWSPTTTRRRNSIRQL